MELIELGSILHMEKGKKPLAQSKEPTDGYLPYVDIKAFEQGIIDNYATTDKSLLCDDGDLLIVCDGSRSGLTGIAIKGIVGSTLSKIYADGVITEYLRYFIQSKYLLLNTQKKGTGTPHLNTNILKASKLVVPSISEQQRIVSRIEELFSLIDNAVEALQKTKEQLAVYRQAVLKEVLGSQGDCNSTLGEVILYLQNGLSKRKGTDGKDIVVLRLANIDNEKILDLSEMRTIMLTDKEQESYLLNEGDGLIIRVNGSMNRVGRMVLVGSSGTYAFCDHLIRCVFDRGKIEPRYAKYLLDDAVSRKHIKDNVVSTAGQNTISQGTIKSCPIYLPSLENQREMIQEIDSRLPMCDSIEQMVDIAILQAEAMRQSILKEAFEGRL